MVWIIAGPNGVGKSTWATSKESIEIFGKIPVLNPDHFAAPYTSTPLSLIASGKRIFNKINELIALRQSFAVETTLSGTQYFRLARSLKKNNWNIGAVFIGVEGEDICIGRVDERKLGGGHDVPLKDILRRYERSLQHIPELLEISHYAIVLDNSQSYQQVFEKSQDEVFIKNEFPCWLKNIIEV